MHKNKLAPGDSTVVELIFNTRNTKSAVVKNATISCNDSTSLSVKIGFSAKVFAENDSLLPFKYTPSIVNFTKDANKKVKLVLENKSDSTLQLASLFGPEGDLKMKIKDEKIKPHDKGTIEFQWKGEFFDLDSTQALTFALTGNGQQKFTIPVVMKGLKPPPVQLPKPAPTTPAQKTFSPPTPGQKGFQTKPDSSSAFKIQAFPADTSAAKNIPQKGTMGTIDTSKAKPKTGP